MSSCQSPTKIAKPCFATVSPERSSPSLIFAQRPEIGAAHRAGCNRHARADVKLNADRLAAAALPEIDHAVTVAAADRGRATGRAHHVLAKRFGQMPNAEIG